MKPEIENVKDRYARRLTNVATDRYSFLNSEVWQSTRERLGAILSLLVRLGYSRLDDLKLVEVGCGTGGNLLEFLRIGFQPENLRGIELLPERVALANRLLPPGIVMAGDATTADLEDHSQDIVYQSVVFSSVLDDDFQDELAKRMWAWVKPGGGILWYDFTYDNPSNPDVRGVPVKRIRELFPHGTLITRRVTLAPPLSRFVTRLHPSLYTVLNWLPFLRTHVLCWIGKTSDTDRPGAA